MSLKTHLKKCGEHRKTRLEKCGICFKTHLRKCKIHLFCYNRVLLDDKILGSHEARFDYHFDY